MTPETKVKKKVIKWLKELKEKHPSLWWTSISDRYHSGLPDFMYIHNGKATYIEVKAATKLSKIQEYVALQITNAGGEYLIVTETDIGIINSKGELHWEKFFGSPS